MQHDYLLLLVNCRKIDEGTFVPYEGQFDFQVREANVLQEISEEDVFLSVQRGGKQGERERKREREEAEGERRR